MPGIGHSTAAILDPYSPTPKGTGFLVGRRLVLTCAHVVGDALGNRNAIAKSEIKPAESLRVRFTVAERPTVILARVSRWSRYFDRSELASSDGAEHYMTRDLALLELDGDPPRQARPVRFWTPSDTTRLDHIFADRQLVAGGYPRVGSDAYHSLQFTYESLADGEEFMVRQVDTDLDQIDLSGLSGAGLVLRDFGLVIGIVMEVGTGRNLVVAKPARQLLHFYEDLRVVFHGCELRKEHKVPAQLLLEIDRASHRDLVCSATKNTTDNGPGVMLATILGRLEDRVDEWIDFLVSEFIQHRLESGLSDWVEPIRPIRVYRKRGMGAPDLFRKAMDNLAKRLGIKFGADFVDKVRGVLNEEDVGSLNRTEPPPYLIFEFSAQRFSDDEIQVMERLIRFWDDVARGELERSHLVFFTLVIKAAEEEDPSQDLQTICTSLRGNFSPHRDFFKIIDPLPGVRKDDVIAWIRDYEDGIDALWPLDMTTANHFKDVVHDIFIHEVIDDELTLNMFHKELEKLDLCQKYQEV
jgi:hypothetical protein